MFCLQAQHRNLGKVLDSYPPRLLQMPAENTDKPFGQNYIIFYTAT